VARVEIDVWVFDREGYGDVAAVVGRSDYAFDAAAQVCFIQTCDVAPHTEDTKCAWGGAVSMAPLRQARFLSPAHLNILLCARCPTLENRAAVRFLAVLSCREGHGAEVVGNVVRMDVFGQVYDKTEVSYGARLGLVILLGGFAVRAHYVDEGCWGGFGKEADGVFESGGVVVVEWVLDVYRGVYDGVSVLERGFGVVR